MGETIESLEQTGQNRLGQVCVKMPEVRLYFSGDREQQADNLKAYLDGQELKLQSLQRFSEGGESIRYYVLLDVSASIRAAEFRNISEVLSDFAGTLRPQDHMVFLTFGEEVDTLFDMGGGDLAEGGAEALIGNLENTDQRTLLFEAIQQAATEIRALPASENARSVVLVITDGEDIAEGKATRDEALQTLQKNGIPVYGFTVAEAKRDALNAFGEFSRATGGYLTILEEGSEQTGFEAVREEILDSYEALFAADSNQVSHGMVSAVLEFVKEGEKQQLDVMQERWIQDTENPVVVEILQEGSKQVRVLFSEPVEGADAADNFRLETEGDTYIPAYASVGSSGDSVVLTFSDDLAGGDYRLVCNNITDSSMERNPLENAAGDGAGTLRIERTEETVEEPQIPPPQETNLFREYGWAVVLALLVVLTAGCLLGWRRLKKRQAVVTVEGKAVLESNTRVRHRVSMEEKALEEKQVFFHVEGQREEIPITIRRSMIVGRASACELIFDDPALSRQHFALELKDGKVMIQNLSQSGFTSVNGIRLGSGAHALKSGDKIGAGQLKLTVRW